ncbi:MAG: hypothetical protein ACUVRV_13070 [Cyanobacteriota bacterium]
MLTDPISHGIPALPMLETVEQVGVSRTAPALLGILPCRFQGLVLGGSLDNTEVVKVVRIISAGIPLRQILDPCNTSRSARITWIPTQ